jgi:hypothetical protein
LGPEKVDNTPHPKVTVEKTDSLPFLDMKLYWDEWGELSFTVYRKDGQLLLKYLNADSTHPPHIFRAVPHSAVLARLANLITLTEENGNKTMKEIHPDHINTLKAANLDINALHNQSNKAPTLLEMRERSAGLAPLKKRGTKRIRTVCEDFFLPRLFHLLG